jgi:hypothetical protein
MAAGTRVNPLDTVPLRAPLVFLDGDDPDSLPGPPGAMPAPRPSSSSCAARRSN